MLQILISFRGTKISPQTYKVCLYKKEKVPKN
jgi:hypothetical protein